VAWDLSYVDTETFLEYVSGEYDVDDPDTAEADGAVAAASRAIDLYTRRQFGVSEAPEVRQYRARRTGLYGGWVLDIDDLHQDATAAVLVDGLVPAVAPMFWPLNRPIKTRMEVTGSGLYAVTAVWGWPDVPATIVQATNLQAARFFKRRDAPFGVAGSPDSGSEVRLLERVDPDVAVMCKAYRRRAVPK
jgi:hypothetical protein